MEARLVCQWLQGSELNLFAKLCLGKLHLSSVRADDKLEGIMTALERIEVLLPELTPAERLQLARLVMPSHHIEHTSGVNGGSASIGQTRIAVWMLEAARREGLRDGDILAMYPQLGAADLVEAWSYVAANGEEIERDLRENAEI